MSVTRRHMAAPAPKRGLRRWVAGSAVASLLAGAIVVTDLGTQVATAAGPAPSVSAAVDGTYIAGEDLSIPITFSGNPAAGPQYNLSAGVVLPADVTVISSGTLGAAIVYPAGATLTGVIAPGAVPPITCASLGLEAGLTSDTCTVAADTQYLVFQNISDLPSSATTGHALTVRPSADAFPVGAEFPYQVNTYTSGDPRFLPVFPGSTGVNTPTAIGNTSDPGIDAQSIQVNALRITKSEPSPESKLLRGVHDNTTVYTLRIHHTGEDDLDGVQVVDFIPAGLEYLGVGGIDNTTNANGTQPGGAEYPGASPLSNTPSAGAGAWQTGETVETVIPTTAEVEAYGLVPGAVYTKVTWNLGQVLATADPRAESAGIAQDYASTAGQAGVIEIRYRAGVPLFENTLDFDGDGGQPPISGEQAANLDNNRGPSTRHGSDDLSATDADANTYVNVATVRGEYNGIEVEDHDAEAVHAVDVRVLKAADTEAFAHRDIIRYTLTLRTSEYIGATQPDTDDVYTLLDTMGDGMCPVFSGTTAVWDHPDTADGVPYLIIGTFADNPASNPMDFADWNEMLSGAGLDTACTWDPNRVGGTLVGAALKGIAFDPIAGRFEVEYVLSPVDALDGPNEDHQIGYSVRQNTNYTSQSGWGKTTSGDRFENTVDLNFLTTPIDAVQGVGTPGLSAEEQDRLDAPWNAWDDSAAVVQSGFTDLTKHVLQRDAVADVTTPGSIVDIADSQWVDAADDAFFQGDAVWYRIRITPPSGTDVRNPLFTDFLSPGLEFDASDPGSLWVVPASLDGVGGTCGTEASVADWVDRYASAPTVDGNVLAFNLGSSDCLPGNTDRFLPLDSALTIYIKATVTDVTAFGDVVDVPQNLAKYQQENVHGDIFFLRDTATVELDRTTRLIKGIWDVNGAVVSQSGAQSDDFNSNIDGVEVVQQDRVTFRLDVTAPFNDTSGYLLYDVLPAGISASDIDASAYTATLIEDGEVAGAPVTFTASALDPGEPGYPANLKPAYQGRSVIVWNVTSTVSGSVRADGNVDGIERGLTLGYTVVIPDGSTDSSAALVTQQYVNDASIVEFDVASSSGVNSRMIIDGDENVATPRTPDVGEYVFEDENNDTSDPSSVFLPNAAMQKTLISTEVGPNPNTTPAGLNNLDTTRNGNGQIVQGELATYEIAVTVPAHTTVRNGVLEDDGVLRWAGNPNVLGGALPYHVDSATVWNAPGVTNGSGVLEPVWGFDDETGTLTFPELYHAGDEDRVISVRITVWIDARDASNPNNPQFPAFGHNLQLVNTATFNSQDVTGDQVAEISDTANVNYIQPNPTLTKSVTDPAGAIVAPGGQVAYELRVSNQNNRPALYDVTVLDCVPADLQNVSLGAVPSGSTAVVTVNGCSMNGQAIVVGSGDGTLIEWTIDQVSGTGTNVVLPYTVTVHPEAGGLAQYTNYAELEGFTLPSEIAGDDTSARRGDRVTRTNVGISLTGATISKSVSPAQAPVGETVTYTIINTLPADANYYDVELTDTLPIGLEYVAGSAQVELDWAGSTPVPSVGEPDGEPTSISPNGRTLTWAIVSDDVPTYGQARTITITFDAKITDDVAAATPRNTATFSWNSINGDNSSRQDNDDFADVTILNPVLGIQKDVKFDDETNWRQQAQGNPDRTLDYRIIVTNTGNTASFHNVVTDTLPAGVVSPRDFTINGAAVAAPNTVSVSGNAITWTIPGSIETGATNAVTLAYTADFAPSDQQTSETNGQPTSWQTNTARVTHYESFEADGREYNPTNVQDTAQARPLFPRVNLTKAVADTTRNAYVGEPFEWILTATNNGVGAAQKVVLTDVLPENWIFTEMVSVTVAGTPQSPAPDPTGPAEGPLQWIFGEDAADGAPAPILLPGQSIVIRYTATPLNPDALTTPGVGSSNPHTNTLSAQTTDTTNETSNQSRSHTGLDATDDAFLREADLRLEKTAIGGTSNGAHGLPNGSWVPGESIGSDYAQPQWQITVNNYGPDTSHGPFEFTDTPDLPAGVTMDDVDLWEARYYSSDSDATGTLLVLTPGLGNSFTVGDESTSLGAGAGGTAGADRIVITANVYIPVGATGTAGNVATVDGRTYEDPTNKPADADNPNTDEAEKPLNPIADLTIAKVVNTTNPVVGGTLTWGITVTNLGPSISVATEDNPITITDTVPAGVTGVTATSNSDWTVVASNGFPAETGDVITWTYAGTGMPVGNTAQVTLSGTVASSHTGPLVNEAQVTPGLTPEPDPHQPNEDDVTVTPNDDTSLEINKTRVVFEGGEWRIASNVDDPFVAGEQVSYRIDVRNLGAADARTLTVVDESPDGLSYSSHEGLSSTVWNRAAGGANAAGDSNTGWDTFVLTTPVTLPADETRSLVVTYNTLPTVTGDVVNWAEASADNSTNEPRDPDNTGGTDRHIDLEIVKTHTSPVAGEPAVAGESVDYRLVVTNNGPSVATPPITVVDTLPVGFNYQTDSTVVTVNGTPAPVTVAVDEAARTLTWSNITSGADFAPTDEVVITFTADIAPSMRAQDGILNSAVVSGNNEDTETNIDNNDDNDPVNLITETEMEITKVVEDGPWIAGTNVEYTLDITNNGPSEAPASVIDTLPAGLTMVSMSGTGWDCSAVVEGAQTGACDYTENSSLHPVGSSTITVVAQISPSAASLTQPLTNEAVLTWTDSEGTHTDEDEVDITVTRVADLGIAKTALDAADGTETTSATAGESLWYRLVVTNYGDSDAIAPIVVEDALPSGISFVALTPESETAWDAEVDADDPQQVTFTRTPAVGLLVGTSAPPIVFEVLIDPAVVDNEPLNNIATIADETLDPNGDDNDENNTDDASVTVERSVDVSIEKGHIAATPVDEFPVGAEVDFTFTVTNDGPSVASGITITDTLPLGLSYSSLSGTDWSFVSQDVDADGRVVIVAAYSEPLAPEASTPQLTITAEVTAGIGDETELTNNVCVGVSEDNVNADPCDSDTITTVPLADLAIEKSVTTPADDITAGQSITWELDIRNLGPSDSLSADGARITVTDVIPAGVRGVLDPSTSDWAATVTRANAPSSFPAQAGDVITWTFQGERIVANPDLDADPAFSITLTGWIDPAWTGGEILNTAVIEPGVTRDPEPENNEDEIPVIPGDGTTLSIWKTRVVLHEGEWVPAGVLEPIPAIVPGTEVSYRITVVNNGPADARIVTVVDEAPEGLTYREHIDENGVWDRVAGGSNAAGESDTGWDTFTLSGTQQVGLAEARSFIVTYEIDPILNPSEPVVNEAEATAENSTNTPRDEDPSDGQAITDLSIVKTSEQERILAGGSVDYRLLVTNEGPSAARGPIVIVDALPIGMTYEPGSATIAVVDAPAEATEPEIEIIDGSEALGWAVGDEDFMLLPGQTIEVTLRTKVAEDLYDPEGLVNVAIVFAEDDENPVNNSSDAIVRIDPVVTLVVEKEAIGEFQVGKEGRYEISITNLGPTEDPGPITVTDALPDGLTFASSPDENVTVDDNVVTWTIPDGLQVGEYVELTLIVNVGEAAFPSVTNVVTIDSPAEKTPESILSDDATVDVAEPDPLVTTGASLESVLLAMMILLLAGGGAVLTSRRRKASA